MPCEIVVEHRQFQKLVGPRLKRMNSTNSPNVKMVVAKAIHAIGCIPQVILSTNVFRVSNGSGKHTANITVMSNPSAAIAAG